LARSVLGGPRRRAAHLRSPTTVILEQEKEPSS
jgi:hypothetical protein